MLPRSIPMFAVAAAAALCSTLFTSAGVAVAAPPPALAANRVASLGETWGTAEEVPGTAGLNVGGQAEVEAVSCASAGNCSAGGEYEDAAGNYQVFVVNEVNGTWGTAEEVPGTAGLHTEQAVIESVSCASAGNCSAGGYYWNKSHQDQAFIVNEVDGAWGTAEEVPGTADHGYDGSSQVTSVSCVSAGNCGAGGHYGAAIEQAFVVDEVNGSWGTAEEVPGIAGLNAGDSAGVASVSCASAGNCSAGGDYTDGSNDGQAFAVDETGGTWGTAQEVPGFAHLNTGIGHAGSISSVSCTSAGNCSAGGVYIDSLEHFQVFVVNETGGTWGTAAQIAGTAHLNTGGSAYVGSVSCASAGNCSAGGVYTDSAEETRAFVVNETGGTWGTAAQVPGAADLSSVSCASAGNCSAGGAYSDGQALVVGEVNGTWGAPEEVPGTASLNVGGNAQVNSVSCTPTGSCSAGGSYTDASSSGQAFVASSSGGCQQVTLPDGDYEFSGCVIEKDDGTLDVTNEQSNVDGVDVSASASDRVSYDDGGAEGNAVTSSKASTLSLALSGTLIKIFHGVLDKPLTQPITVTVPKGTQIAGQAVSGTLTLTPGSNGQATGSVGVTLPPVLGGGKGTLKFTTTVNAGLSSVQVTAQHATFMQLFSLSKVSLSYTASTGTWAVSARASTGGSTSASFSGSLVYASNTLTSGSLSVGKISLAGLVDISQLTMSYGSGTWTGSATFKEKSGATQTASITLGFTGTTLTSGSITASDVPLFGVLDVASFSMSYGSGNWDLSVTTTLSGGGGGSATLTVSNGTVTAASLSLTNLSFLGKFTVADATVSYSSSAPNPVCHTVPGTEIWCGNWQVQLPQATIVTGVSGAAAFADGSFASGSVNVSGDLPLIDGLFLTSLTGTLTTSPPPTKITGGASIAFGPTVNGATLLSGTGTLTRTLPGGDTSGSYAASVMLSALNQSLGTATVNVPGDSAKTTIELTLGSSASTGLSFSKLGVTVQVTGELTGSFSSTALSVNGSTDVTVNGTSLAGSMKVNGDGMAACATTSSGKKAGFEYVWSTGDLSVFGTKGCSERGF